MPWLRIDLDRELLLPGYSKKSPEALGTHVAEKYIRQVNFYRGRTVFVSAAALKPSMSLCCCAALKTHLTDVLFGDMSSPEALGDPLRPRARSPSLGLN